MKASTTALLASTLALAMTLPAQAARHGHDVYDRLDRQQTAIDRGVDSGDLTRHETRILRAEHREIRDLARSLSRDRHASRDMRRLLDIKLDRSERHIRRLASNDAVDYRRYRDHRPERRSDDYARTERRAPRNARH